MQTLARVNRTYLGKADGLLVGYAPLVDNLQRALSEYTTTDQRERPVGRSIDEAVATTEQLLDAIADLLAGHDWRAIARAGGVKGYLKAVRSTVDYVRTPTPPDIRATGEDQTMAERYRSLSGQLARAWALCSGSTSLAERQVEGALL